MFFENLLGEALDEYHKEGFDKRNDSFVWFHATTII